METSPPLPCLEPMEAPVKHSIAQRENPSLIPNPIWRRPGIGNKKKPGQTHHVENPSLTSKQIWRPSGIESKNNPEQEKQIFSIQDRFALLGDIKACGKQRNLIKGSRIHSSILENDVLANDVYVRNALISMYAKCGEFAKARELFGKFSVQNVVSWNALISAYVEHGLGNEALNCYRTMQDEGLVPNAVTFICTLKACGAIGDIEKGEEIHAEIDKQGFLLKNIVVGTSVVDMYARCGMLAKAREVLHSLPERNVVSWTALIGGYAQHGIGNEALKCFQQMKDEGILPNAATFSCVLKACASTRSVKKGEEVHAEVRKLGLLKNNLVLGTALLDMYAKCGDLDKAQALFDGLPQQSVVSWNALITGYVQHGFADEAINSFNRMRNEGHSPNVVTYASILKACGILRSTEMGEEIHAELIKQKLLVKDIVLGNALVDMYAKCGNLDKARVVFDELPIRNTVSWNALISGYVQYGLDKEALNCFNKMRNDGLAPDDITFTSTLKACIGIGSGRKGKELHVEIIKQGLLEDNTVLGTALVDMYAKFGAVLEAQKVFDELSVRDTICWNALIAGYAQYGHGGKALNCFSSMLDECLSPDETTYACILKVCSNIGSIEKGEEIHDKVREEGLLGKSTLIGTALVDMYAKCGVLAKAQDVFDELPVKDAFAWTALMAGHAQLGQFKEVLASFNQMISEGIVPDVVTFVVLLTACSHAGLVEEGEMYFNSMNNVYHVTPTLEHNTCMVDLYSRAGHFDKAMMIIEKAAHKDRLQMLVALMASCRKWQNVHIGSWAFEHSVQLDAKYATVYVSMRNIYAAAGMIEEVEKIGALQMQNKAWEIPGYCWWTDARKVVHSFTTQDNRHPQRKCIDAKVNNINEKLMDLEVISDYRMENVLCGHNEKLAVACALINTPQGMPIRVTTNMSISDGCHLEISLISKLEKREIQVKDASRIHIFKDGKCFCEGYQ